MIMETKTQMELLPDSEGITAYFLVTYTKDGKVKLGATKLARTAFLHYRNAGIPVVNVDSSKK